MSRETGDREHSKKTMKLKGQEEKPKLSSGQFQNGRKWSMYHPSFTVQETGQKFAFPS